MTDRLWPRVSWRSRAIRVRSSATARSASSRRAACSSRFGAAEPRPARTASGEIVATVTPIVDAVAQSPVPTPRRRAAAAIADRRDPADREPLVGRAGPPSRRRRSRAPSPRWPRTRPGRRRAIAIIATTAIGRNGPPNGRENGPTRNRATMTTPKIAQPPSRRTSAAGCGGLASSERNGTTVKNSVAATNGTRSRRRRPPGPGTVSIGGSAECPDRPPAGCVTTRSGPPRPLVGPVAPRGQRAERDRPRDQHEDVDRVRELPGHDGPAEAREVRRREHAANRSEAGREGLAAARTARRGSPA